MKLNEKKLKFFESNEFAVVGASADINKFGYKVLKAYIDKNLKAYPVNPKEKEILHVNCFKNVSDLPVTVRSISIITPPMVTEKIVDEAFQKGIKNIWMQPGSENDTAIQKCMGYGINVISNGPCILVEFSSR